MSESVRVDRWLWAVRLFKTRGDATDACRGGHVRVNGRPAKAATTVAVGDRVEVRAHGTDRIVEARQLIEKRVGAALAADSLHRPHPTSAASGGPGGGAGPRRRPSDQARASPARSLAQRLSCSSTTATSAGVPRCSCVPAARSALRHLGRPPRSPSGLAGRGRGGRSVERRQVVAHQRAGEARWPGQHVQDTGADAAAELLRAARRRDGRRLPWVRLREGLEGAAGADGHDDRALPHRSRRAEHGDGARRRRGGAHPARSVDARVAARRGAARTRSWPRSTTR